MAGGGCIFISLIAGTTKEMMQPLSDLLACYLFRCVRKAVPVADFIEINESCPNVA